MKTYTFDEKELERLLTDFIPVVVDKMVNEKIIGSDTAKEFVESTAAVVYTKYSVAERFKKMFELDDNESDSSKTAIHYRVVSI